MPAMLGMAVSNGNDGLTREREAVTNILAEYLYGRSITGNTSGTAVPFQNSPERNTFTHQASVIVEALYHEVNQSLYHHNYSIDNLRRDSGQWTPERIRALRILFYLRTQSPTLSWSANMQRSEVNNLLNIIERRINQGTIGFTGAETSVVEHSNNLIRLGWATPNEVIQSVFLDRHTALYMGDGLVHNRPDALEIARQVDPSVIREHRNSPYRGLIYELARAHYQHHHDRPSLEIIGSFSNDPSLGEQARQFIQLEYLRQTASSNPEGINSNPERGPSPLEHEGGRISRGTISFTGRETQTAQHAANLIRQGRATPNEIIQTIFLDRHTALYMGDGLVHNRPDALEIARQVDPSVIREHRNSPYRGLIYELARAHYQHHRDRASLEIIGSFSDDPNLGETAREFIQLEYLRQTASSNPEGTNTNPERVVGNPETEVSPEVARRNGSGGRGPVEMTSETDPTRIENEGAAGVLERMQRGLEFVPEMLRRGRR